MSKCYHKNLYFNVNVPVVALLLNVCFFLLFFRLLLLLILLIIIFVVLFYPSLLMQRQLQTIFGTSWNQIRHIWLARTPIHFNCFVGVTWKIRIILEQNQMTTTTAAELNWANLHWFVCVVVVVIIAIAVLLYQHCTICVDKISWIAHQSAHTNTPKHSTVIRCVCCCCCCWLILLARIPTHAYIPVQALEKISTFSYSCMWLLAFG